MTKKTLKKALLNAATMLTDTKIDLLEAQLKIEALEAELAQTKNAHKWCDYTAKRHRRLIERVSGMKFVFGFNPEDPSMKQGDESTYDWYLTKS